MIEHLRRKNLAESAEATVEVGRLLYLLGRHGEALQKFDEAIEAGRRSRPVVHRHDRVPRPERRDRRGAQRLPPRACPRPGRAVSEYVKVYTSLWVLDLSRRHEQGRRPEGRGATCARSISGTASCARTAAPPGTTSSRATRSGKLSYEQMLAAADTAGQARRDLLLRGHAPAGRRQVRRRAPALAEGRSTRACSRSSSSTWRRATCASARPPRLPSPDHRPPALATETLWYRILQLFHGAVAKW